MSWYCVVIFDDSAGEDKSWVEMLDSLDEAAEYVRDHKDRRLTAYEIGDDGESTGIILRHSTKMTMFLKADSRGQKPPDEEDK